MQFQNLHLFKYELKHSTVCYESRLSGREDVSKKGTALLCLVGQATTVL